MASETATIDNTVRAIIETRVQAIWGATTPIQWPGVMGVGGDSGGASEYPPSNSDWLRVNWKYAGTDMATIGADTSGLDRTVGIISLTVFTPSGVGNARLWELVGIAKRVFNRYNNVIRCGASGAKDLLQQGGWTYAPVITNFEFYSSIT